MQKYIDNFHYLTQDIDAYSHLQLAQMACEAGIKWIQYRAIKKSLEEKIKEINQIAEICDDWGSTLVICQDIELAKHANDYQGLHIENNNTLSIAQARAVIGEDRALGLSCPDINKLLSLKDAGIDYFSIGPYGYTNTIETNYPPLNDSGLLDSIQAIKTGAPNLEVPIIVAGGINLKDISKIFTTGVFGLAVSSAINLSPDPKLAMKTFYKEILDSSKNL